MTHQAIFPTPEHERLAREGMYYPETERDACGVGLIAATDGRPSRRVVAAAIEALKAVWHRGAVDADGKTGDGAGHACRSAVRFFDDAITAAGHKPQPNRLAVGMVFLPRTDLGAQEAVPHDRRGRNHRGGLYHLWLASGAGRCLGHRRKGAAHPPRNRADHDRRADARGRRRMAEFEKNLYLVRRRIEKKVIAAQIRDFYICSLSCQSIVYKGLFLAESLSIFYPDLQDERFESRVASSTSVIRPTPSRNGGWRSPSARWRIMVRSTRSGATRTG
jgi:glutamate synthase (NADPH/NADH) large chain